MDRIKPEKLSRQRVQGIWRKVRFPDNDAWPEMFPDDSLTVDVGEITPDYAIRKIAVLFETKKYGECASLIRRLNCVTLGSILRKVPIDVLHDSLPDSLNILEALYVKLYDASQSPEEFPKHDLQVDQFLQKLTALFAKQSGLNNKHEKNSNSVYPSCRSILRVIVWIEPATRRLIRTRKRALDKCLRHLGRHGLVESSEGTLMNLHDAFKVDFEKVVYQYRCALNKLEELNLSAKHPTGSSVIWGPAPSSSSHHRQMQLNREDVQDRIIKNRTLHNLVEPAIMNQYLKKFIHILEKRIEYDKMVLFHDTEMKKMCKEPADNKHLSVSLKEFSLGYGVILQLLKEVIDEEAVTDDDEDDVFVSSDEEAISPLMHKDRIRSLSGSSSISKHSLSGTRPSIIHIGQTFRQQGHTNGLNNGYTQFNFHNGTLPARIGKMITVGDEGKTLEHEVDVLKAQLDKSSEMVRHLQERERQFLKQIAELQSKVYSFELRPENLSKLNGLIADFQHLFFEDRRNALEALDSLSELKEVHSLKGKILFSVIVLAFRSVQQMLQELRGKLRHLLQLPVPNFSTANNDEPLSMDMERQISSYICQTSHRFDTAQCVQEVSSQIFATLYDYPCLKDCEGLRSYITNCVHTAWGLSVQNPSYVIVYDSRVFNNEIHVRHETSDIQSVMIRNFLWPALIQANNGPCVQRGIVET